MTAEFHLRQMQPADGEALRQLMENDPESPGMSMTTRFLVDPYIAWKALKPNMLGVVAEMPGVDGLVGVATVAFFDIQFNGQVLPAAFLENLKVRHDYRGRGLGTRLAQWRFDRARERFGDAGVIMTGTTSGNTPSLATMKKWAKQFVGPVIIAPYVPRAESPEPLPGITVRAPAAGELKVVAEKANRFYADHNLYAPLEAGVLATLLNEIPRVYHYCIAVDANEAIVAGIMLSNRAALMYDQFNNVPPPVKASGMVPPDERLRTLEAAYLWFESLPAARYLWESVRWEFRDHANAISAANDPRSPAQQALGSDGLPLKLEITVALNAPAPLDTEKPLTGLLRG